MQVDELILGKYRLKEFLSSGGFSSVFRAREEMTKRTVALKALAKAAYPAGRIKFLFNEFQAMSKIWGHPNIVSIHTVEPETDDYAALIVMEYVDGKSLYELMLEGPLPLIDTINIGLDICLGLKEAHAHKIVHRDIKPQNILLTSDKQAKIADFSIARIFGEGTEFAETVAGTQRYMSPEQHYGHCDYRADLYSTSLVLYQAVTGRFPFSGKDLDLEKKKAAGEIEDIDKCPEVLRSFIQKALHRQLSERHQNATEMYEELDQLRQDEYVKQSLRLIDAGVNSDDPKLAEALERCRRTFHLSLETAERINQNIFFQRWQREVNGKQEKLVTQAHKHYTLATRYIESQNYSGILEEIHKAACLSVGDQGLVRTIDDLFQQLNAEALPFAASPTVEGVITFIQKLSNNEKAVLRAWLEHQKFVSEEKDTEIIPIRPLVKTSNSYRMVIEKASPEFLLNQVHIDIQYPHEKEACHILQKIRIYKQQGRRRQYCTLYRKLGNFYQKQARLFDQRDHLELVANCYMRAGLAYAVIEKHRLARGNAKNGGIYYTRLAQHFELQRSWEEAGKSYILAAFNHSYANLPALVQECYKGATGCYFNAAEGARLNCELQTAYDYYMLIVTISEKMSAPTKVVTASQKLLSKILVQN